MSSELDKAILEFEGGYTAAIIRKDPVMLEKNRQILKDRIAKELQAAKADALRPFAVHQDSCKTLEAFYAQRGPYKDPRDCFDYLCDCGGTAIIERLAQLTTPKEEKETV